MSAAPKTTKANKAAKKVAEKTFTIDCSQPAEDGIFDVKKFEEYLQSRIKVNGKVGQLAGNMTIASAGSKVTVHSKARLPKKYLKYLTKKFLRKNEIRDYVRVVASNSNTYQLRYFQIEDEAENEEEEQ